jgi:hypothetical protein
METNENGLTQDQWISKVDELCIKLYGVGIYDVLGDFESWTPWYYGENPEEYWHDELRYEVEAEASLITNILKDM